MCRDKRKSIEGQLFHSLLICGVLLLFVPQVAAQPSPDLIIVNADVRTMSRTNPRVKAIAIRDGRVTAVGTTEDIRKLASGLTRTIDAQGQLVLPGFNDAHSHLVAIGNIFSSIDLSEAKTQGDVIARLRHFARFLPKGRWILGGKLDPSVAITLADIDAATPDNPLFVYHADAKSAVANSFALRLARAGDGTGVVRGTRLTALKSVVPLDHIRDLP